MQLQGMSKTIKQSTSNWWNLRAGCPGRGHDNPLQYSCLENHHGQRSPEGYNRVGYTEGCRVQHSWATRHSTAKQALGVIPNEAARLLERLEKETVKKSPAKTTAIPGWVCTCLRLHSLKSDIRGSTLWRKQVSVK